MISNPEHRLYISLNRIYSKIRIHKLAFHTPNDPKYVQILVNPDKSSIAIRGCESLFSISPRTSFRQILLNPREICRKRKSYLF